MLMFFLSSQFIMKWLFKFDKDKWQKRQRQMQKNLRSMESIRKINRELILFFKRNHEFFHVERCIEDAAGDPIAIQKMFDSIPVMASDLMSGNESFQFVATARLSFLLSTENPPIDVVIQSGVVPHFVRFLNEQYGLQHKLYSVRALYAIGKGSLEQAVVVIKHGAIPMFIRLLCCSEECYQLKELVAAALGSLASQSPDFRDYVLQFGTLTPLLSLLDNHLEPPMLHEKIALLRACSNTLAIFCQGNPAPSFNQIRSALPILRRLIHLNPPVGVIGEVCEDACLCLSYQSNGSAEQI
ncbi:importin subunit alpha-1a isoform X1 [Gossypium hirsutum]|uniref:Importin subunit alpha-1a isoform X1 n=5 Tax=Gossypium TaxID=3633 RepID=A0A1U8KNV7_GOSHI|nr:importin subunit alpha-1a-like isoform X1 [Gossypium hirsutum]